MSHTPSHIDNGGDGMLMTRASDLSGLCIGVLTPFNEYSDDVRGKSGKDLDSYLRTDASIPFVSNIHFNPGQHVAFRIKLFGNEDCQFAIAVDLYEIDDQSWSHPDAKNELTDQDVIN